MDIAICSLEFKLEEGCELKYAGANNPLWIIRSIVIPNGEQVTESAKTSCCVPYNHNYGNFELFEIIANKQPIGKFDNPEPYTTHTFELQKGDSIYIFSDGFADQFGGEKGKKMMYKPFKELLISLQDKTMDEQKVILEEHFENWKGSLEQVDDVCVIGVRI